MNMKKELIRNIFYAALLLVLPLGAFAAGMNFFAVPAGDVSVQVLRALLGTGQNELNGQLIRPLLMVMCTGIVLFMGVIFAWNLTKLVLHTAQEGEMMVGKGKNMGLVVLRSVFGIAMVLPIYSGTYKGLCLAFIFVTWLITQGIGLADQGTNVMVDYLTAGGTIYQIQQSSQDTADKQSMVKMALDTLGAQTCVYKLQNIRQAKEASQKAADDLLERAGQTPVRLPPGKPSDIGYDITGLETGSISFGTRNKQGSSPGGNYFNECGTVSWNVDADKNKAAARAIAIVQMLITLDPLARQIANSPNPKDNTQITNRIPLDVAAAIFGYSNSVAPLRNQAADEATKTNYNALQGIKLRGWITLGAYYPMMGNLNQQTKTALAAFLPSATPGALANGQAPDNVNSAYNLSNQLLPENKGALKSDFDYILGNEGNAKSFIAVMDAASQTLARQLQGGGGAFTPKPAEGWLTDLANIFEGGQKSWQQLEADRGRSGDQIRDNPWDLVPGGIGAVPGGDKLPGEVNKPMDWNKVGDALKNVGNTGAGYLGSGMSYLGLNKGATYTGETLGGTLEHDRLAKSATAVGLASAVGGPIAWVSIPPALIYFVQIVDEFRDAIDQTQSADPLIALQNFGFKVMDKAAMLMAIVLGGTFIGSVILSAIPSGNFTGMLQTTSTLMMPFITIIFMAMMGLGVGFGIYLPMIPFIVWISAILGWLGHAFQAIVGAPLVALRMTTAEGEGALGGATEGVMMLLGLLLTPFLLVLGFCAALILIKQVLVVVNYLFSIFIYHSFYRSIDSTAWILIGAPAVLFLYFTLAVTVVQSLCTKFIGELPGEVLKHVHQAMVGHRAAEQFGQKMEHATDSMGSKGGDFAGKGAVSGAAPNAQGSMKGMFGGGKGGDKK